MKIKQECLSGTFKICEDLSLKNCKLTKDLTLILKTKDNNKIDLNKYVGCVLWISRTPINQDIEIYKKLK